MQKNLIKLLAAVVVSTLILTACNKNSEAKEALRALRKIEAATQVGVTYQEYGSLIIDAQAKVNEATAKLPDGELKQNLYGTITLYAKIRELWGTQIKRDQMDNAEANQVRELTWRECSKSIKRIAELLGE